MTATSDRLFQTHDFAARAGVSVRTLHHYDRIGLLGPAACTAAGYRLYGEREFVRLQHIQTLKFLGFPLRQIGELLGGGARDLAGTLRVQRRLLFDQKQRVEQALHAIDAAEEALVAGGELDWATVRQVTEAIIMANDWGFVKQYYADEARAEIEARQHTIPREVIAQGERDWAALIAEVEAAVDEDPAGEHAQRLAVRWSALLQAFTNGSPAIQNGLNKLYADRANWPATAPKPPFSDAAGAFIRTAMASRNGD